MKRKLIWSIWFLFTGVVLLWGATHTHAVLDVAQTWSALQTFGTNISIGGVTAGGATGTGNVVFATSPTITGASITEQFVDCHAACTGGSALTAAQLSNALISNISLAGTAQANSAVAMTGPTPAAGMSFIMILGSAEGASATWTYNSTGANVYLDGSASAVTNIGFGNSAGIGSSISCVSFPIAGPAFALKCTTLAGTSVSS